MCFVCNQVMKGETRMGSLTPPTQQLWRYTKSKYNKCEYKNHNYSHTEPTVWWTAHMSVVELCEKKSAISTAHVILMYCYYFHQDGLKTIITWTIIKLESTTASFIRVSSVRRKCESHCLFMCQSIGQIAKGSFFFLVRWHLWSKTLRCLSASLFISWASAGWKCIFGIFATLTLHQFRSYSISKGKHNLLYAHELCELGIEN